MGASALMSIGVRAMAASYAALQTTGNNISNANTPGYSRQQVILATSKGQYTGAGFFGKGVDVISITRSYNQFLTREAESTSSVAASDQARSDQLTQLQNAFPLGETGIGYAAGQFFSAMSDLASDPGDSSARQVVLSQASSVASRIGDSSSQLDTLQSGINQDLATSVSSVNSIAANIASVNKQIAAVQGGGQPPNDLLDQRDQLISQLSAFTQVTTIPASDGSVGVFISGGQRLVLGSQSSTLQVAPDQNDPSRAAIAIDDEGSVRNLSSDSIGGSMGGLLTFQNTDLVDARNQLGQLSAAMAGAVNKQQALGLDLGNPAKAGAPIFAVGAPAALPSSSNAKDANGNYLASITLTTADASQLQASDYTLKADPANAGQYTLTRQSDGLVRTVSSGDTVDGMTITVNDPAPGPGDQFLLQPVGKAAAGFAQVLDDPSGIAAASPVSGTMPPTNTGTATIASLSVTDSSNDPSLTTAISFTDGTGDYNYSMTDSGGNVVSSGTGTWTAGQPIQLNGFSLALNGVPASGDQVSVSPTLNSATSNGNALAMTALQTTTFVGKTLDNNGNPTGGATITDAYAAAMADVGVRVQSATNTAGISQTVATTAQSAKTAQSGVSLDEEAARLIQYQQSYQAAAKVLSVAQQIFDTLLQTTGSG